MIKRNAAKPVRVAPPMMEEQEVSTSTLQELLEKEETVSNLILSLSAWPVVCYVRSIHPL